MNEVDFLEFRIENGKISIKEEQLNKLCEIKIPRNVSELRSLVGFTAYFKKFVENYSERISPLLKRLKKENFKIEKEELDAINKISEDIRHAKSLNLPDMSKKLYVYCDASNHTIGGALKQGD